MEEKNRTKGRRYRTVVTVCMGIVVFGMLAGSTRAYKMEDLNRLNSTKQCPGCDLTSADLKSVHFSYL